MIMCLINIHELVSTRQQCQLEFVLWWCGIQVLETLRFLCLNERKVSLVAIFAVI